MVESSLNMDCGCTYAKKCQHYTIFIIFASYISYSTSKISVIKVDFYSQYMSVHQLVVIPLLRVDGEISSATISI